MNLDLTKQDLENWAGFVKIVRINKQRIKELQEDIKLYSSVDYKKESASKTPSDIVGNLVVNYLYRAEKLLSENQRLSEKINNIEDKVDQIEDSNVKIALKLRYGEGLSWGDVAREINKKKEAIQMFCNRFIKKMV